MYTYSAAEPITANTEYQQPFHAIYVGDNGSMTVEMRAANSSIIEVTFDNLQAGTIYNIKTNKVVSTTANNVIGLY